MIKFWLAKAAAEAIIYIIIWVAIILTGVLISWKGRRK